jgi:hypothetical protein
MAKGNRHCLQGAHPASNNEPALAGFAMLAPDFSPGWRHSSRLFPFLAGFSRLPVGGFSPWSGAASFLALPYAGGWDEPESQAKKIPPSSKHDTCTGV